ncbi:hypothetical protein MML61_27440 (plasmid) [Mycobacterium marinum]|uniref:hypothetical protein n=1 Tax=Mycobacterium marinum TaxID=1781 RepID=UPI00045FC6AC|nr:hypothetical protein [Mycobacterium marinum]WCS21239.1 hypothetical protein MML61_27440 [Mycobacterium marinum]WOR07495.1 hypothetical protein QDR78_27265 [Mycobacterium marinum]CDM79519.1 hypothetical protein MMARE11_p00160 [Mycobacterium marinum E11]BBC69129.1 hypothetical protein MMRN_p0980 [Mycobacterium marinum]GJO51733.1 hypothetical protein NJB1604_39800 [Mycobacterium marinum]
MTNTDRDNNPTEPRRPGETGSGYEVEEVELRSVPPAIACEVARREQRHALIGLLVGSVVALLGVALICLQVSGPVKLDVHSGDSGITIDTWVVGIVVLVLGVVIIWLTRAKIKIDEAD